MSKLNICHVEMVKSALNVYLVSVDSQITTNRLANRNVLSGILTSIGHKQDTGLGTQELE